MNKVLRSFFGGFAIVVGLLVVMLVPPASLRAQEFYGTTVGTVTDASGAVVPGATVTIVNLGTNETRTMKTGKSGEYSFVNLVPANYKLDVTDPNFKHFVREPISVQVGNTVRVDVPLQVGAASEVVEVTTQTPLLQTQSSAGASEIEGETVQEMPLNGRNPLNLIELSDGVVPGGSSAGNGALNQQGGNTQPGGWGNYAISGGFAGYNAFYLDGAPNNVLGQNNVAIVPTQDSIQEFSVLSSSVPAEYGRFEGGVVNMTTKSGTNRFHGGVYEYVRNRDFNSNDFITKGHQVSTGQANIPNAWTQNQFGAIVDGPIKRDRAFFMFNWEEFRLRQGETNSYVVPTALERMGVFTGLATPLVDPLGRCNITTTGAAGSYTSTITNLSSCQDPTGATMAKYYDAPNANSGGVNYITSAPSGSNEREYNGRVDYNVSQKQRIFGRYTYWKMFELPFIPFPDNTTYNTQNPTHQYLTDQAVLGDTYTINSNTIADLRLSALHQQLNGVMPTTSNYNQFGGDFSALASQFTAHILPYPYLSSEGNSAPKFHPYGPQVKYQTNYGIDASVVRIFGNHTVKVGWEGRLENQEEFGNENSGSFAFTGQYTGVDYADMIMGYPTNSGKGPGGDNPGFLVSGAATSYTRYQGYYAQDDWRVTQNLTINAGLRYELPGSIEEAHDKQTVFLPNAVDPVTHITGTLALVNSSLYPSKYVKDQIYEAFSPRLGAAYKVNDTMSIRGGYALTWLPIDAENGLMAYNSPINGAVTGFVNPSVAGLTAANLCSNDGYAANCFHTASSPLAPAGTAGSDSSATLVLPAGRTQGQAFMSTLIGQAITGPIPTDPFAYNQQYNVALSQTFAGNMLVEFGYAGAQGTHLPVPVVNNGTNGSDELAAKYMPSNAAQLAALQAPTTTATVDPGGYTKPAGSISVGQSLRPFFAYEDVGDSLQQWGSNSYNSGHVKFEKRFASGGLILANYTWEKNLSNTDEPIGQVEIQSGRGNGEGVTQDWNNHAGERSVVTDNVPHRFVVAYVAPLPFGHGRMFGSNASGFVERIIGGWELNGITQFQSGFSQWLIDGNGNYLTSSLGAGQLRPIYNPAGVNAVGQSCNGNKRVGQSLSYLVIHSQAAINTGCFSAPTDYQFGNQPRVDGGLRDDAMDNWDMTLVKKTRITESTNLELRAEFFNVFNRTQFGPPNNDIGINPGETIDPTKNSFGQITILGGYPRLMQFSGRFNF